MGAECLSAGVRVFSIADPAWKAYNRGEMTEPLMRRKSWRTS
jgi:hypothetical protein